MNPNQLELFLQQQQLLIAQRQALLNYAAQSGALPSISSTIPVLVSQSAPQQAQNVMDFAALDPLSRITPQNQQISQVAQSPTIPSFTAQAPTPTAQPIASPPNVSNVPNLETSNSFMNADGRR